MTVTHAVRDQVRERAQYACEFCGITETDTGGELTLDHFQPRSKGGDDSLGNLIYCCARCNQYKHDYWPASPDHPQLWHPNRESASQHFLELVDGALHPLTPMGAFTLDRLRLNRPPLIAHRLRKRRREEEVTSLALHRDLALVLEQLLAQQAALLKEQKALLEEQRRLLEAILELRAEHR